MATTIASVLVRVSLGLVSRVSLLLSSDTILKAINMKLRLMWKPVNRKENHDVFSFIIFLINKYSMYKEGE